MRAYEVVAPGPVKRYAGTSADARSTREALMAQTGAKKKDVSIDEVEIPTAKPDLLGFLNGLLEQQDPEDE